MRLLNLTLFISDIILHALYPKNIKVLVVEGMPKYRFSELNIYTRSHNGNGFRVIGWVAVRGGYPLYVFYQEGFANDIIVKLSVTQ